MLVARCGHDDGRVMRGRYVVLMSIVVAKIKILTKVHSLVA